MLTCLTVDHFVCPEDAKKFICSHCKNLITSQVYENSKCQHIACHNCCSPDENRFKCKACTNNECNWYLSWKHTNISYGLGIAKCNNCQNVIKGNIYANDNCQHIACLTCCSLKLVRCCEDLLVKNQSHGYCNACIHSAYDTHQWHVSHSLTRNLKKLTIRCPCCKINGSESIFRLDSLKEHNLNHIKLISEPEICFDHWNGSIKIRTIPLLRVIIFFTILSIIALITSIPNVLHNMSIRFIAFDVPESVLINRYKYSWFFPGLFATTICCILLRYLEPYTINPMVREIDKKIVNHVE